MGLRHVAMHSDPPALLPLKAQPGVAQPELNKPLEPPVVTPPEQRTGLLRQKSDDRANESIQTKNEPNGDMWGVTCSCKHQVRLRKKSSCHSHVTNIKNIQDEVNESSHILSRIATVLTNHLQNVREHRLIQALTQDASSAPCLMCSLQNAQRALPHLKMSG